jgi:hypothetical protein
MHFAVCLCVCVWCVTDVELIDVVDSMVWNKPTVQCRLPIRPRYAHTANYHQATNSIIVVGGASLNGDAFGDVHTLNCGMSPFDWLLGCLMWLMAHTDTSRLLLWPTETFEWTRIKPSGDTFTPRYLHTSVLYHQYLIVFGGTNGTDVFNDLFFLNLGMVHDAWMAGCQALDASTLGLPGCFR